MGRSKTDAVHVPVREHILRLIRSGGLSEGDPIETEESLTQRFAISRRSVRTALQDLTDQGYLRKIQGKGTFVSRPEQRLGLSGQSKMKSKILVLLSEMETPNEINEYHRQFIEGIAYGACLKGYSAAYMTASTDPDAILSTYEREGCGGIIWLRADVMFHQCARCLEKLGIPQVLVNRTLDAIPNVCDDEDSAFRDMIAFLAGLGHRQIAFLNADLPEPPYPERTASFKRHMDALGSGFHYSLLEAGYKEYVSSLEGLFSKPSPPSALIIGGCSILSKCLSWLSARRIPDELSILCFNDSPEAMTFKVPLTVYSDPRHDLGRKALDLLELAIYGRAMKGESWIAHGNLIARKSCAIPAFMRNAVP